ncbi:hypothetical protein E2R68_10830 [Psychromonas sp. RZ22]|uniref:PepSY domain-containing protein n=1 Tax=Psychromonas algarum TaxID=2555643 RepID=UPI0010672A89|nr:PepSY domain-containing protein [Psychromonas sp. RZ22]TEW53970.1 hypothetical protein E2R68_10830 [Psychromonas sp. RZ22]
MKKFTKFICVALAATSLSVMADDDNALSALALQRANYSLEQAVEKVSQDYKGQITEFEVDDYHNRSSYEIETINLVTSEKHKLHLSLEDGSILKEKSSSIKMMGINRLDDDELFALKELQTSDFKLDKTIAMLKEKYNADVFEFELESEKGITFYKFKMVGEQGIKRVLVDVKTGSVIPVMSR